MSHKKFGPDRFSRFDVYWIQTNRQTDKQTDKQNLYIEGIESLSQILISQQPNVVDLRYFKL